MTDIQGALGCAQMDRARRDPRRAGASSPRATTSCSPASTGFATPHVPDGYVHGYQAYVCLFRPEEPAPENVERLHRARNDLMRELERAGIQTRPGHARAGPHGLLRAQVRPAAGAVPERVRGRSPVARAAALPADDRGRRRRRSSRALTGVRYRLTRHVRHRRRRQPGRLARRPRGRRAHDRGDRPPRPRRQGHARRRRASGSATAGWRSSTSRRAARQPMASRRRRASSSPTTARSTTSASCGPSSSGSGTASARAPTPRSCCTRYAEWGERCVERFNGMFALRDLGPRASASSSSRATATASSRSTTPRPATPFAVRLRDQGDPRAPGVPRRARAASTCSSTSRSRTSSPTARCSTASSCCRRATA